MLASELASGVSKVEQRAVRGVSHLIKRHQISYCISWSNAGNNHSRSEGLLSMSKRVR
nr:MAG TPA: hypothetical protein [Caudoviricetes sp.]